MRKTLSSLLNILYLLSAPMGLYFLFLSMHQLYNNMHQLQ
nr:MAG TPA: Histidine kinase receptor ArcB trans-membrane domain [Caudoviricetes sp.]